MGSGEHSGISPAKSISVEYQQFYYRRDAIEHQRMYGDVAIIIIITTISMRYETITTILSPIETRGPIEQGIWVPLGHEKQTDALSGARQSRHCYRSN